MKIRDPFLLAVRFITGIITHSLKAQIYKNLLNECNFKEDHMVIKKGIVMNKMVKVNYGEIHSIEVNTGLRYRFLSQMKIDIIPTHPDKNHITIVTNYSTANKLREKVEERWANEN